MLFVNIIGVAILSVFALFVITKKEKTLSDYLLLLIVFLFSGILVSGILLEYKPSAFNYFLFLCFNSFIFPSLIIYGLVLLEANQKFNPKWFWTASYAFAFIIYIGFDTLLFNTYNNSEQVKQHIESPSALYTILYKGQYVFVISVLIWFVSKLKTYQKTIKNVFSSIEKIHLNWFKNFIYIYLGVNIVSLILFIILDLGWVSNIFTPLLIEHIILVLALFYLCYHGIKQYNLQDLSLVQHIRNPSIQQTQPAITKYNSSSLSTEEMNFLFSKIERLFNEEQIFLDSELKIDSIAEKLKVSTHRISQTINTKGEMPFYDYVNSFRVSYLKQLLSQETKKKFTILALGIEAGFNSKATLNRVFKQHVGVTPKTFQKSQLTI